MLHRSARRVFAAIERTIGDGRHGDNCGLDGLRLHFGLHVSANPLLRRGTKGN